jgi:preprotein translocase subunit SecG
LLSQIFGGASQQALANDFVSTMQRILFINAGLWLFTALVATFLPRPKRQIQPALAAAH